MNEIMPLAATWMDLRMIILRWSKFHSFRSSVVWYLSTPSAICLNPLSTLCVSHAEPQISLAAPCWHMPLYLCSLCYPSLEYPSQPCLLGDHLSNTHGTFPKFFPCWSLSCNFTQQYSVQNLTKNIIYTISLHLLVSIIVYWYLTFHSCNRTLFSADLKWMLLLSRFSRVWLCATPETAAHQALPSLGFSRQEYWNGLPFPSPMHESEKWKWSRSVVSDS